MKLYVVRHATASRKNTWRKDDDLRPLTRAGRRRFRRAAEALVRADALELDLIVTSPLTRAVQTAAILGKTLASPVPVIEDRRLGHSFNAADLGAILHENRRARAIAIVGHNPSLCEVLAQITDGGDLDLRKGAIALVDVVDREPPRGRLLWLAPPSLFDPPAT